MSHLKKEIKDEKEGAEHYRDLAEKSEGKNEEVFEEMAEDESGHAKKLRKMEACEESMMAPVDVPREHRKLIKR